MLDLFKDISGKITLISIVAFIFGSCIITYHLSLFQIQDFDLLKPHAVIVGLVYLMFLGINIVFFAFRAGSTIDYNFNTFKLIIGGIIKIPIISLLLFYLCEPYAMINPEFKLHIFTYSFDVKTLSIICILNTVGLFGSSFVFSDDKKAEEYLNKLKPILITVPLIAILLLFLTYVRYSLFQSILAMETSICFCINLFIIGYRSSKLHEQRIADNNIDSVAWSDDSYINFGKSELGLLLKKTFLIIALLFVLLKTTIDYAGDMFSNLPQSYGGGRLTKMSLVVNNDTITGNKVYETKEYLFLAKKDSAIVKLDWKEIKVILKSPNNK